MLTTALLGTTVLPAGAALLQKIISIYTGVNIYIDDQKFDPKDANGNPIEAFVHNGTTYLPVRAIGEAYGKNVQWESKTQNIYIGSHESNEPAVWLKDLDYFTDESPNSLSHPLAGFSTAGSEKDSLGNTHSNCITQSFTRTYRLNGQYSRIAGTLYQTYDQRSDTISRESCFHIYGDGKLIYSATFPEDTKAFDPKSFDVDLIGVLELKIKATFMEQDLIPKYSRILSLGDCGLYS